MSADPENPLLPQARLALERGDYGQVIRLLTPSPADENETGPALSRDPEVLLMLATAQMGLGRSSEALLICRRLRSCGDARLRAQARELQRVLEAPSLQRPREWSLTLPALNGTEAAMGRQLGALSRRRRRQPPEPPPPAVGPTRAPVGFAVLVALLVGLALMLGGCGAVYSELRFSGPGRLQISHQFDNEGGAAPSWQQQLMRQLSHQGWSQQRQGERIVLQTPVLPSRTALERLAASINRASELAGIDLPPPQLTLRSRNWLVAVDERFELVFDLRPLPAWASPDLGLILSALPGSAVRSAAPAAVQPLPDSAGMALLWPLQSGVSNRLVLHLWRWSPLGLGSVAIAVLLLLSLVLQRLRRALGFGLPELPG